ncbi:MAG TPA: OmpA family protein [Afipia sp.]
MKKLRLILLATTALSAAAMPQQGAFAQTGSFVVAQAEQKPAGAPKGAPHPPAPPKAQPRAVPTAPAAPAARPAAPAQRPATPAQPKTQPPARPTPPVPPHAQQPAPAAPATPQTQRVPQTAPRTTAPEQAAPAPQRTTPPASNAPVQHNQTQPQRPANAPPLAPGIRDVTPPRPALDAAPHTPNSIATPPGGTALPNAAPATPNAPTPGAPRPGASEGPRTERRGPPPGMPAGTPTAPTAAPVAAPLPAPPAARATTPLPANVSGANRGRIEDFRSQRQQTSEGGRTVIREPGRVIIKDPNGQSFIRHNEEDRFRLGARDVQVQRQGNDTRTVVMRPDGTQIITESGPDGGMLRRMRRDREGREFVIIDNRPRGIGPGGIAAGVAAGVVAGAIGGYFVSLPPPVLRIPQDRYIVDADGAPPELIYDTLIAPPVDRLDRAYSLDEIRYSPSVRQRMPSIDLDTINFETGSWDIPADQAAKLQAIADGLNRAIQRNPNAVFLIEGHTDAVGSDVDNLSLSDRRAESAAELLSQQFGVPPENLATQGYGEQYLKVPTDGPERLNRRVTVRNITPLLNGGEANAAPPPR